MTDADPVAANLFRMILANPSDDGPRLVFAEYLEDRGYPGAWHGEFIRVQIELAKPFRCEYSHMPCYADLADALPVRPANRMCSACLLRYKLRGREQALRSLGNCIEWFPLPNSAILWSEPQGLQGWRMGDGEIVYTTLARGFPAAVTLPMAAFVGNHCERCGAEGTCITCGGSGEVAGDYFAEDGCMPCDDCRDGVCPACNGTATPGLAAALFQAAPLESVTLSDRQPEYVEEERNTEYYHWVSSGDRWREAAEYIPSCLFKWLPRGQGNRFVWDSPAAAQAALSAAAVAYGRSLVPWLNQQGAEDAKLRAVRS